MRDRKHFFITFADEDGWSMPVVAGNGRRREPAFLTDDYHVATRFLRHEAESLAKKMTAQGWGRARIRSVKK